MEQQVLIIEPSSDYYLQLKQTMIAASPGIQFHQAADAGDAVNMMKECSPSICLIDDAAAQENNAALLNLIHQHYPSTIIIHLTESNNSSGYTFNDEHKIHFRFNKTNDFENICQAIIKIL